MKYIVFDCDGTLADTSLPKQRLYSGIKELILALAPDHMLFVWTARDRASTLRILEENGIAQFFEGMATISDAAPKPHIQGLRLLVDHAPKGSVCVIGDSSNDMIGAKNFGVLAIGAVWSSEASSIMLRDAGADFIVSHPSECSKLVEQNLKGDPNV
jgi:phosphoglycolate phosphatase